MLSILIPRFLMKSGEHLTSISWVPAVGQVAARRDVQSGIWVTQSPMLAFCIWLVATSIEIQTKIKGELSSLEQLEWTAAVNNGCSGFYFPISEFQNPKPKSFQVSVSFLCLQNEVSLGELDSADWNATFIGITHSIIIWKCLLWARDDAVFTQIRQKTYTSPSPSTRRGWPLYS